MVNLYIGHPNQKYFGCPLDLITQCAPMGEFGAYAVKPFAYENDSSFNVQQLHSKIGQHRGPVLLIGPVQQRSFDTARERLGGRVPLDYRQALADSAELQVVLTALCQRFAAGEPFLARDLVLAFLVVRKLDEERMWTGNAKGYLWADDMAKGRGVDPKFKPRIARVISLLLEHDLLKQKRSNGSYKYGLNPDHRSDIYQMLSDRSFPRDLHRKLARCEDLEPSSALELLNAYDKSAR